MPEGPAESPRVREFAERSLREMPIKALMDKAQFLASMKILDNRILGIENKEKYANSIDKKLSIETTSSSMNKANSGSDCASMTISPDMRVASVTSLEKIRNLRHNVIVSLDNNTNFNARRTEETITQDFPSSVPISKYAECEDSSEFSNRKQTASMMGKTPVKPSSWELNMARPAINATEIAMDESRNDTRKSEKEDCEQDESSGNGCMSRSKEQEGLPRQGQGHMRLVTKILGFQ